MAWIKPEMDKAFISLLCGMSALSKNFECGEQFLSLEVSVISFALGSVAVISHH